MQLPLSTTISNQELAHVFELIAQVLQVKDQNQFRARAYEEASGVIRQLPFSLAERFAQLQQAQPETAPDIFAKELDALPGIGTSIVGKLLELFQTGSIASFAKYVKDLPNGVYPLIQLYGIGYRKALRLAEAFHLDNASTAISELLVHAKAGEIQQLEGFGEKSETDIIEILEQQYQKARIPLAEALLVAKKVRLLLEKSPSVQKIAFLGSLRRQAATVGDIDLGAVVSDAKQLLEHIRKSEYVKQVLVAGENMIRLIVENNWQVDLKLSPLEEWGSFIQHFTGSKEHNIHLRELALKQGYSLSEHGIKIKATGKVKKFADETDFYHFLGLALIPPAERIGSTEFERYALTKSLPIAN